MKTSTMDLCKTTFAAMIAVTLLNLPTARAEERSDVSALDAAVASMAAESGPAYLAARDDIVAQGQVILPELDRLAAGEDWRVAAAARASAGWIRDGETYQTFLDYAPMVTAAGSLRYTRGPVPYDEVLAPLLVEMLLWTEPDGINRVAVADLLRRIRDPQALSALGWVLGNDEDRGVRRAAAAALDRVPEVAATEILTAAIRIEADAEVRRSIAAALGSRKDVLAVPVLLEKLAYDSDGGCRAQAAQSLGWIRDPDAMGGLVRALFRDADPEVRGQAALALGKLGGERAEAALKKSSKKDDDEEVRRLAGVALDRLE
jgi:HEAT repeats